MHQQYDAGSKFSTLGTIHIRALPTLYLLLMCFLFLLGADVSSRASAAEVSESFPHANPIRRVVVTRHKSRTFEFDTPFASAVVGAPDIADVLPMSDRVIYLQGKKIGTTNVSIFDQSKQLVGVIDIEVSIDADYIARKIRESVGGAGVRVSSNQEQIVLSGKVRNSVDAERAVAFAKGLAPDNTVVNMLQVASAQQVLLKVRFIEASREAGRNLGINWLVGTQGGTRGINTGVGGPTQIGQSPGATPGGLPLFQVLGTFAGATTMQPFGVAVANLANSGTSIDVIISALESRGVARRLAEPDLVALSGDTASFLAGGEIPVPVVQPSSGATPTITVDYKPFGVNLSFVPTVLADGIINLKLSPSVSQLDYTNAIRNQGFVIPALTKREAKTTIELRDGQSFAIAGLLQSEGLRNISEVPWLGSVPVLGALLRSASYQQNETDLVVIVTPHLVSPAAPGQRLATPLDTRQPSNDRDLFLLGRTEVGKKATEPAIARDASMSYGHILE
jgi:pilus assembly protein CpaC